jgi:hypothetical protein
MSSAEVKECLKCGAIVAPDSHSCSGCTWPVSIEGWRTTTRRVREITLDTSCVNAKGKNRHLNLLEAWETAGWIRLRRAPALLAEFKGPAHVAKVQQIAPHPFPYYIGAPLGDSAFVIAGPELEASVLARVLFPTTATRALTPKQQRDIEHVQQVVRIGGDCFVTINVRDFVRDGRQDKLRRMGIWIFTPEQMVDHLLAGYGDLPHEEIAKYRLPGTRERRDAAEARAKKKPSTSSKRRRS